MASLPDSPISNEPPLIDNPQLANIPAVPLLVEARVNDPRNEGFINTYRTILCPHLKIASFFFMISVIDILVFVATLIHSSINGGLNTDNKFFLAPRNSTLIFFGAKVT